MTPSLPVKLLGDGHLSDSRFAEALADYTVAENEYREGLKLDEESPERWNNLCRLLRDRIAPARKKHADEAGELLAYKDALAAIERAVALADRADYRKVRDALQTVLETREKR